MESVNQVLYEFQPCRVVDLVDAGKFIIKQVEIVIVLCKNTFTVANVRELAKNVQLKAMGYLLLWVLGYSICVMMEIGALYVMATLFLAIFLNLGERKAGELSAYSVFNEGFATLQGQLRAEDFDREIRHQFLPENDDEVADENDTDNNEHYEDDLDDLVHEFSDHDDDNEEENAEGDTNGVNTKLTSTKEAEEQIQRTIDEVLLRLRRRSQLPSRVDNQTKK